MINNDIQKFREDLKLCKGIGGKEEIKNSPRVKDIIDILSKFPEDWNVFICGDDYDLAIWVDYDNAFISIDNSRTIDEILSEHEDEENENVQ